MKCQFNVFLSIIACFLCLQCASSEPPKVKQQPRPLVFKSWPPSRHSALIRSNGIMMHLRGAGSTNIASRLPAPGMMIKSATPIRFGIPSRPVKGSLLGSQPSHVFFSAGFQPQSAALKRPYAAHLTSPSVFKFSTQTQKTAIKFQSPPSVPLRTKPEYIYEKVNVPKHPDPVRHNVGSDGAIHTIPAPNLSINDGTQRVPEELPRVPEVNGNNLNSLFDSDLASFSAHGFALEKPIHQYQVQENINDYAFQNSLASHKHYYAPDNDPSLRSPSLRPVDDPLSVPSDGKPKPLDVQYHQNLDGYAASPLIQAPQYSVDPFGFPVTSQPQLQQYHLQQSSMLKQGMPLASLNPTYLVMQSNHLLGQHQQHLTPNLFRPEHGYIHTSSTAQPTHVTYNPFEFSRPQEVASLGQLYSAHQDSLHHQGVSSTQSPSTISTFIRHEGEATENNPSYSQVLEPKPSNYQYAQQNYVDLPDEHLTQNDIQNLLSYNGMYQDYLNHRQFENDLILREAQEKLQNKLSIQQQQQQTAYDLHQLVQQEKYNPLRIVVPDNEQDFKRRSDINDETPEDTLYDDEEPEDNSETRESESSKAETEDKKPNAPEK